MLCRYCIRRPQDLETGLQKASIPMVSARFEAVIQNSLVSLTILQEFVNDESEPIECEYTFPIIDDAVVTGLKIYLADGSVLRARVEETEKAAEEYQDAISEGNTAIMSQKESEDKMTIHIGNLAPNDSIRTEFTLASPLVADESNWMLSIPSGFLPIVAQRFNRELNLDFSVTILESAPILEYSSNFELVWTKSPDNLNLEGRLVRKDQQRNPDHHIWVKFRTEATNSPSCTLQTLGNRTVAMVSFVPYYSEKIDLEDIDGQGEFIFVLDRSGSMQGPRIELAKQSAILFLKSLPMDSRFNIISFGSNFDKMFPNSQPNSAKSINSALTKISKFGADMGGTNILNPLESIFNSLPSKEYPRIVFLITDGQVGNTEEVVKLIRLNCGRARVHGFGIGDDVDRYLIKAAAKAGRGSANFVSNMDDMGKTVIGALQKCLFPCVNSWGINIEGESYPKTEKIGDLFYGERCLQYIMLKRMPEQALIVNCFDNYRKAFSTFTVSNFHTIPGDDIFKLWGKNKIDWIGGEERKNDAEIIQLSKEFGIPSSLTSYICIKENENPVIGDIITKKIPIRRPQNSSSSRLMLKSAFSPTSCQPRMAKRSIALSSLVSSAESSRMKVMKKSMNKLEEKSIPFKTKEKSLRNERVMNERAEEAEGDDDEDISINNQSSDVYMRLISNQASEGFWEFSLTVNIFPNITKIPQDLIDCDNKPNVYSTLFVLCYLHEKMMSKQHEWVLIEKKALRWLKLNNVSFANLKDAIVTLL